MSDIYWYGFILIKAVQTNMALSFYMQNDKQTLLALISITANPTTAYNPPCGTKYNLKNDAALNRKVLKMGLPIINTEITVPVQTLFSF